MDKKYSVIFSGNISDNPEDVFERIAQRFNINKDNVRKSFIQGRETSVKSEISLESANKICRILNEFGANSLVREMEQVDNKFLPKNKEDGFSRLTNSMNDENPKKVASDKSTKNIALRALGIVLVGGLLIWSWLAGWFFIVFYILGFYAAAYIVSYLFKTIAILAFLSIAGTVVLMLAFGILDLYLSYLALDIMFNGKFLAGLLRLLVIQVIIYPIAVGVMFVLGYPIFFMMDDIGNRFKLG